MIRKLLLLGLAGYALSRAFDRPDARGRRYAGRVSRPHSRDVRAAGTREMKNPPRHWDMTDERTDESFPASDPPGNY